VEFRWVTMDEAERMRLNEPTRILLEAVRVAEPGRAGRVSEVATNH
jgi:hypothetical protein